MAAAPPAVAGTRPDGTASRLAPWNAPDPFCRKNCAATKTCGGQGGGQDAQKSSASHGSGRGRR